METRRHTSPDLCEEKMTEIKKSSIVVSTFGGAWADHFETSLARGLADVKHLALGNPQFKLTPEMWLFLTGKKEDPNNFIDRLNKFSRQASEILFRLKWFLTFTDMVLVDCSLLNTAIGHQILVYAQSMDIPCYGVGVDDRSSPLAPAYLKGILYPASADDLVRLALQLKS